MTVTDYSIYEREQDIIIVGMGEETFKIDVSFIPSSIGYKVMQLVNDLQKPYDPAKLAEIIRIVGRNALPNYVTTEWIIEHSDYSTLCSEVDHIVLRAYGRAEKNVIPTHT